MEDDWDLHAVVRGCATSSTASASAGADLCPPPPPPHSCFPSFEQFLSTPNPFETRNTIEELHELYKPFFPKSVSVSPPPQTTISFSSTATASPSASVLGGGGGSNHATTVPPPPFLRLQQKHPHPKQQLHVPNSQNNRTKRR